MEEDPERHPNPVNPTPSDRVHLQRDSALEQLLRELKSARVQNNSKVLFEKFQIWEIQNVSASRRVVEEEEEVDGEEEDLFVAPELNYVTFQNPIITQVSEQLESE